MANTELPGKGHPAAADRSGDAKTPDAAPGAQLPGRLGRLLPGEMDPAELRLVVPTGTKVDVGGWLNRGRVWLCAAADRLVLLAAGHDPYVETVEYAKLRRSAYNPVTGRLVLAGSAPPRASDLALGPPDAHEVLKLIRGCRAGGTRQRGTAGCRAPAAIHRGGDVAGPTG